MNEIVLMGVSFVFVFALSVQQQNIFYGRYIPAVANAAFIASLNLFVVKMGSQASPTEVLAFIVGQPLGTAAAMWLSSRRLRSQIQNSTTLAPDRGLAAICARGSPCAVGPLDCNGIHRCGEIVSPLPAGARILDTCQRLWQKRCRH